MSPTGSAGPSPVPPLPPAVPRWYHKMTAVVFITFCLEIGLFLLIFPWTEYWSMNYFARLLPQVSRYWDNSYVRGGCSGLGLVNLYISLTEMIRLRRFGKR